VVKRRINVLFADDDIDNQQIVEFALRNERMNLIFADNGVQAFNLLQSNSVDIVILDIMMPVMDGLEACRKIRRVSDVPIIMLTVKGREQEVVDGFSAGADDYIVKPFRPRELVARMNALMKRSKRPERNANGKLAFGNLSVDLEARLVRDRERYIEVTPREFQLLQYLMQHVGIVISKEDLLKNVWGYEEYNGGGKLIETTIRRLRKKVEVDPSHPRYIQTVWGSGYRLGD
jgi:DNA-binding response OmpR family regulator